MLKAIFFLRLNIFVTYEYKALYVFTYFLVYFMKPCKIFLPVDCCSSSDFATFFCVRFHWGLSFIQPFSNMIETSMEKCWVFSTFHSARYAFPLHIFSGFSFFHCNVFGFVYCNESISIFNLVCQFLLFFPILLPFDKELKMIPGKRTKRRRN